MDTHTQAADICFCLSIFFFFLLQTQFLCSFCWILSASEFCCGLRGAAVSWLEACLMGIRTRAARHTAIFTNHRKHTNSSVFMCWLVAGGAGSSLLSLVSFGSCIFLCSCLQSKSTEDYWKVVMTEGIIPACCFTDQWGSDWDRACWGY